MIGTYAWRGGREAMLRFGPDGGEPIVVLAPLFEEFNRLRYFIVALMRALAVEGIATCLPDLPGQGDSVVASEEARFTEWEAAIASLAPRKTIAFRGGALLDGAAENRWRFAPETGARLLRDMVRSTALMSGEKASELAARAACEPVQLAGNAVAPELYAELERAVPHGGARILRLDEDSGEADARVAGSPLWRRAEPGDDAALRASLVADIIAWRASCAAR